MKYSLFNSQSIIGWILLCISILYGINTLQFPKGAGEPGPAFLPFILAGGMLVCSIVIIGKSSIRQTSEEDVEYKIGSKHFLLVLFIMMFIILVTFLGFIITSLLLLFFTFRLYGVTGYIKPVLYSIALTAFIYLFFHIVLNVPLDLM